MFVNTTVLMTLINNRIDSSTGCPILSMVRLSYDCIIGDVPFGELPFDRL